MLRRLCFYFFLNLGVSLIPWNVSHILYSGCDFEPVLIFMISIVFCICISNPIFVCLLVCQIRSEHGWDCGMCRRSIVWKPLHGVVSPQTATNLLLLLVVMMTLVMMVFDDNDLLHP